MFLRRPLFAILYLGVILSLPHGALANPLPYSVPFEFENNQIFVKTQVNGSAPRWFILDSGASGCVIDKAAAHRLRIRGRGAATGTGAGQGSVAISFADNVRYGVDGWTFTAPTSYLIDLSAQKALQGRAVGGILGYDFFAQAMIEIDFEARVMTLHPFGSSVELPAAAAIPTTLVKKTPHIQIRVKIEGVDPVHRDVLVDLGSGDGVDVDELAKSPKKLDIVGGVGLGQEFRTTMARAEWAEIGPFRLAAPTGAIGGVQLIGLEVLRRFDLIFDYDRKRLLLAPNRFFVEPFQHDASGLTLRWSSDMQGFMVHDVNVGSSAAESGLKAREIILAINNRRAPDFTIEQASALLSNESRSLLLLVRGDGGNRQVTLKLRKRL